MNLLLRKTSLLVCLILSVFSLGAQNLSGKIIDAENESPLIGANIRIVGTTYITSTDLEGFFNFQGINLEGLTLEVTYIGYQTQLAKVKESGLLVIKMKPGSYLNEVVVTGTRGKPRTILTSPLPIDHINAAELQTSGQNSIDQMLSYKVPSFNSTPQPISDATAHFDPSELRNLGPSRTLVLVNGKRKNQSAQVYLNRTPGKGEVGTDLKAIPAAAIERIEVLRDGASVQYGSDAIAGVINIILKERFDQTQVNLESGITSAGDGFSYSADINHGLRIGKKGFLNLTGHLFHHDKTNRAGEPGGDGFFGFLYNVGAIPIEAAGGFEATPGTVATAEQILNGDTDWQRANPGLGMIIGLPEQDRYSLFTNFGLPYKSGKFYINAGYTFRYGKSFGAYRSPWWPGISGDPEVNPLAVAGQPYQGFQPTFESDIHDITFTIGNELNINGWDVDMSITGGSNEIQYLVGNSINTSLGADSPTEFDPGAYQFSNILGNIDVSRSISNDLSLFFGAEIRRENFEVRAGEEASYFGSGVQSFPGLQPSNALNESRTNAGVYAGMDYEVSPSFLIGGGARFENYSKIGDGEGRSNFSWKVNARQLLGDKKGALRASVNTGFRAPSLHQIYLSNIQTLFVGQNVGQEGTFNNVSDITRVALGVPQLDVETSFNMTAGITYKFSDHFSASLDFYHVAVQDRVLLSNQVATNALPEGNSVRSQLENEGVESFKFFTNAADTKTKGFDLVLFYDKIPIGQKNKLGFTLALNHNTTKVDDDLILPPVFAENNIDIFGREEIGRLETGRPNWKASFGSKLDLGSFSFHLNNTYFGEVTETNPISENLDQVYSAKILTDLRLSYGVNDKIRFNLSANNLFNIFPDEIIGSVEDLQLNFGGRFRYPWHVQQFGLLGAVYKVGASIQF